ncbi:MAG: bifunctional oligoribonuclease/PAP phosphatase NrnA [Desulfovibrionaceae bacterium]|nr:bifunctional oligoribonuclease/PAP phosphatase NrnA [Desulfovibrionaceae bacterium]
MQLTDLAFPLAWRERAALMARALLDHDMYLVCAHIRLDGDALSSMAAMGCFLEQNHKRFLLYAPFGVPENYDFLELPAPVYRSLEALPFRPRTVLALDCGDPGRLGEELSREMSDFSCINIDHHPGPGMGSIASLVVPEASSTTQVIASVLHAAGCEPEGRLAQALALGLITDTGGFRHANASPEVFALAALLEQNGVSIHKLREKLEKTWSYARMRLWGHMSSQLQLLDNGRLALCCLSLDSMEELGAKSEDTEGYVEHMRELRSVLAACLVREQSEGVCKFSLRSTEGVDVRSIAASLGGGGHVNAAGGTLNMSLESAERTLVKVVTRALEEQRAEAHAAHSAR